MAGEIEAELKFAITRPELEQLRKPGPIDDVAIGKPETSQLASVYFDTPDGALRKSGISLRIRRIGKGRTGEQTVKFGTVDGAALASRREVTVPTRSDRLDLSLFADEEVEGALRSVLGDATPGEAFTVRVKRTARLLVTKGGDEIEYALDDGEVIAGGRNAEILEAEFELKSGDPRSLFLVAKQALSTVPVRFSGVSKSERGYRLAEGSDAGPAVPAKAVEAEIAQDATVEQALQAILRSCLSQIAANVVAVEAGDDPEGPHQLRVGLRRLRSALGAFKPAIDRTTATRVGSEARWLGALVGELRDLDVLHEEIVGPCAGHIDVSLLEERLRTKRIEVREHLVAALAGPRAGAFLIDLAAYVEGRGWLSFTDIDQSAVLTEPVAVFAERAIHKSWTKVARMGRDLDALSGEERHELRKAFKKLRYTLDFFGGLIAGKDRKRLMREVKAAQEVLGYLNDVRMAHSLPTLVGGRDGAADPGVERAIGFCLGWHEARAEHVWQEQRDLARLDAKEF